jgi:hypothetical protein
MFLRMVARGRDCPRCGARADRAPAPAIIRLARLVVATATYRKCGCGWRGLSV